MFKRILLILTVILTHFQLNATLKMPQTEPAPTPPTNLELPNNRLTRWLVRKVENNLTPLEKEKIWQKAAQNPAKKEEKPQKSSKASIAVLLIGVGLLLVANLTDPNNNQPASTGANAPVSRRRAILTLLGLVVMSIAGLMGIGAAVADGVNGMNILAILVGIPTLLILLFSILGVAF